MSNISLSAIDEIDCVFFFLLVVVVDVSVKSKTHLNVECDEYRIISSVLRLESICVRVLCMKVCDSNE